MAVAENVYKVRGQRSRSQRDKMHFYIRLYSPYNMVAQANNTGTSKNTTNEKEKK